MVGSAIHVPDGVLCRHRQIGRDIAEEVPALHLCVALTEECPTAGALRVSRDDLVGGRLPGLDGIHRAHDTTEYREGPPRLLRSDEGNLPPRPRCLVELCIADPSPELACGADRQCSKPNVSAAEEPGGGGADRRDPTRPAGLGAARDRAPLGREGMVVVASRAIPRRQRAAAVKPTPPLPCPAVQPRRLEPGETTVGFGAPWVAPRAPGPVAHGGRPGITERTGAGQRSTTR